MTAKQKRNKPMKCSICSGEADYATNLREFLEEEYGYTEEEAKLIQEGKSKGVLEARYAKDEARQQEILDEYLKGEE